MEAVTTPTRVPLPVEPKAPSKRKLAQRVFGNRPIVLNMSGRKRPIPGEVRGRQKERALKQIAAGKAMLRRLDASEARQQRRNEERGQAMRRANPRYTLAACSRAEKVPPMGYPAKEKAPVRIRLEKILLEKGVWLELQGDEYDFEMDERLLVLRYVEGFAGLPAPMTTVAEMRAHGRGQEYRRQKEGNTDGMLYSLGLDLKPLYLLIHSLYVFAEERQAFADGLAGVQREFDDEVVKEREGELVRCFNDDPAYVAYEEGKTYRLTHEWFFCPGAGWDLMPDHEGMREFHLSLAAQGQAASTPLTEPQRRTFDFNACLLLGPDQQDLPIVHPILLTRYLEGLTGVLYPGQYKTHAENAAYSVGEESRQFLGGESSGMD
ncbi:MAG: hypothetical protein FD187_3204, partial [bacterium]